MLRALPLFLLIGCPTDDTGADHTGQPHDGTVPLSDEDNASLTITLNAETAVLAQGQNCTIDWAQLSVDLLGRPIQPTQDITEARIYSFQSLDPASILAGLATETLSQADVSFIVSCTPENNRCNLADFVTMGHWIIPSSDFVQGQGLWLLELKGEDADGPHGLAFLQPAPASPEQLYTITNSSSSMDAQLDLTSSGALPIPTEPDITIDWSDLLLDAQGVELDAGDVDRVVLHRFEQADHADDMLAWSSQAAETWSLDVGSTNATLEALVGDSAFTGIDADSTWLLALYCRRCDLPVPRFVTLLEPHA